VVHVVWHADLVGSTLQQILPATCTASNVHDHAWLNQQPALVTVLAATRSCVVVADHDAAADTCLQSRLHVVTSATGYQLL
jgi:hypothetical protein